MKGGYFGYRNYFIYLLRGNLEICIGYVEKILYISKIIFVIGMFIFYYIFIVNVSIEIMFWVYIFLI